jgi:hypothetical protein
VDRHVAEVRAHVLVDEGEVQALQLLADLHHRRGVAAEFEHLAAQAVDALDVFLLSEARRARCSSSSISPRIASTTGW